MPIIMRTETEQTLSIQTEDFQTVPTELISRRIDHDNLDMSIIVFKSNNPNYNTLEINTNPVLPNEPIIASGYTGMPIRYGKSFLWKEGDNYSYGLDKKDRAAIS